MTGTQRTAQVKIFRTSPKAAQHSVSTGFSFQFSLTKREIFYTLPPELSQQPFQAEFATLTILLLKSWRNRVVVRSSKKIKEHTKGLIWLPTGRLIRLIYMLHAFWRPDRLDSVAGMTQNAFLSSKVKSHFFFARRSGSLSISILSKNVYTESIRPSDRYWHNLKLWKGSLCWVFSEELKARCNLK